MYTYLLFDMSLLLTFAFVLMYAYVCVFFVSCAGVIWFCMCASECMHSRIYHFICICMRCFLLALCVYMYMPQYLSFNVSSLCLLHRVYLSFYAYAFCTCRLFFPSRSPHLFPFPLFLMPFYMSLVLSFAFVRVCP